MYCFHFFFFNLRRYTEVDHVDRAADSSAGADTVLGGGDDVARGGAGGAGVGPKEGGSKRGSEGDQRVRGPGGWAGGSGARGVRCPEAGAYTRSLFSST